MTSKSTFPCAFCAESFGTQEELFRHLDKHHDTPQCHRFSIDFSKCLKRECNIDDNEPPTVTQVFNGNFHVYAKTFRENYGELLRDPLVLLQVMKMPLHHLLTSCLQTMVACKMQLCLIVRFVKGDAEVQAGFWSFYTPICNSTEITNVLEEAYAKIHKSIEAYTEKGSGWVLENISDLKIKVGKYDPFQASSYIPLPDGLKKKSKYVVNVENKDDRCFLYSIIAAKERCFSTDPQDYDLSTVDDKMLQYPVRMNTIDDFEEKNSLSINIIGFTTKIGIHPLRVSKILEDRNPIDLLFISDETGKFHYCAIMDFEGFMQYDGSGTNKKYYCRNCFSFFTKEWLLTRHHSECLSINRAQRLRFPITNKLSFHRFERKIPHNWVVYADFECMLVPIAGALPSRSQSSTTNISKHVPISYGFVVIGHNNEVIDDKYYCGTDAVENFIDSMIDLGKKYNDILSKSIPLKLSANEEIEFRSAKKCHFCNHVFTKKDPAVRDHSHWTGEYRGAAHQTCNLKAKEITTIPVCFHGLGNYDSHLLVMAAQKFPKNINVIASNSERFKCINGDIYFAQKAGEKAKKKVTVKIIDSYGFMNASLATLAENFKKGGGTFNILKVALNEGKLSELFPSTVDRTLLLELLTSKGHYPYEYVNSEKVFEETVLPPKEAFFSAVKDEGISDADYQHAQNVWQQLSTKKFSSYHAVYQMTDVYLLAEVFQDFRRLCLTNYQIEPCYYISTPGLSWAAAMRMTNAELELFTHVNKHNFITSAIRGGLSYIAKRHAVANNKYLHKYDPSKPSIYIMYWDANNLYGAAMLQPLPYSNFRWLMKEEILNFDVTSIPDDGEWGYILEVDLDYPTEMHEEHSDYPLAPEKRVINNLSDYSIKVAEEIGHKIKPTTKLVSTLNAKKKYVVHYRNLKFYLRHGMKLLHVRKILQFRQRPWLQTYIEANTQRRQMATNVFEKDFYKLMNNATYGKSLERKENRIAVKIIRNPKMAIKYNSLPHADSFQILKPDLISVLLKDRSIMCDLPIYTGFCILELSKLIMYEFHYEYIMPKYRTKASLLFTDTDSLAYEIETEDVYLDMKNEERFDTSNYDRTHVLFSSKNNQVLGKFKDELGGEPITEFVGLRSKMYSFKTESHSQQKAKGIDRTFTKKYITHDAYKECLKNHSIEKGTWATIASKSHVITTNLVTKSLLSPFDDKRYILDNGLTTVAHGRYNKIDTADSDFDSDVDIDDDLEQTEKRATTDEKDDERQKKLLSRMKKENEEKRRKEEGRRKNAKRKREIRATMSTVQQAESKDKDRLRWKHRQTKMSEDKKTEAKEKERKRWKNRQAAMTEEQKEKAKEKARIRKNKKRKAMSEKKAMNKKKIDL